MHLIPNEPSPEKPHCRQGISKAIGRAISKAGTTLRHLGWFEVVQIRGSIENNQVGQYQVTVKVGFTLEED